MPTVQWLASPELSVKQLRKIRNGSERIIQRYEKEPFYGELSPGEQQRIDRWRWVQREGKVYGEGVERVGGK